MWLHRDEKPGPSPEDLRDADIRRRLASLKLAGPLMLAALARPGLNEDGQQELMIDALSRLISRTVDLVDRVNREMADEGFNKVNRYKIADDIVRLVAQHWRDNSAVPPEALENLVLVAMREGARLSKGLQQTPYEQGDDATERLSSGIAAAARIALSMSELTPAGHDRAVLYKAFMEHLGKLVRETAEGFGADRSIPAVKALIREFSHLYPLIWKQELDRVRDQLRALTDLDERKAMAERLSPYPLSKFFSQVEVASAMLMEMADSMEVFVRPAPPSEAEHILAGN